MDRAERKKFWNTVCAGMGAHDWQTACRPFWQIIAEHESAADQVAERAEAINLEADHVAYEEFMEQLRSAGVPIDERARDYDGLE